LSFEELFRGAYKLVLKKKQDMLYDRVVDLEKTWLKDTVRTRITALITPAMSYDASEQGGTTQSNERRIAGERFIRALKDAFSDHQLCMSMITDVLMYMVSRPCALIIL
jgi:cullin 3